METFVYVVGWDYDGPIAIFDTQKKAIEFAIQSDLQPDSVTKWPLNPDPNETLVGQTIWAKDR